MGEEHRPPAGGALSAPDRACRALAALLGAGPPEVECAYVFGSRSRGQAGPLSDLDLGIVVREALSPQARLELAAALTEQSERLTHERVDVVILNDAPPALRHRAVRDGVLLFARDDRACVAFEARAIREFLDFQPVLERYDRALLARPGPAALALDDQLVAARLAALDQYLRFLGETARLDLGAFTSDPRSYAAAERFLHLAIESVLDVGTHCIAALGLPRPARYADVVPTLAEAGIVTAETARELANIAGFRNLLVHDYAQIDRARVHAFLNARLDGFRHFAADIARYMART